MMDKGIYDIIPLKVIIISRFLDYKDQTNQRKITREQLWNEIISIHKPRNK